MHESADWAELEILSSGTGTLSQVDVADLAQDAGRLGHLAREVFPEDDEAFDKDRLPEDAAYRFAEEIWVILRNRARVLGSLYPLQVERDIASRQVSMWQDALSYTALVLLSHITRFPSDREVDGSENHTFHTLFEKIAQSAAQGLFRGATVRFGVPKELDWPSPIEDRVRRLGAELSLEVEILQGKLDPQDGDRTLDIASRLDLGDGGPGTLFVMIQCAAGRNWRSKVGEPNLSEFRNLLIWDATLVRAIAMPWWLPDTHEYARQHRHFGDAVILDRPRLMLGQPDQGLDPRYTPALLSWCTAQLEKLRTTDH